MEKDDFFEVADKFRIPFACQIEIIHACNFKCKHCYIPVCDNTLMGVEDYCTYLKEIKESGCRLLTITGGEPLLHPNFKEMYEYAVKMGFVVSIFTNGYLLEKSHIDLFKSYEPRFVEITIYGADNETYKKLTGVSDGYERVINNVENLKKNNIRFQLKTFMTKLNVHDFEDVRRIISNLYGDGINRNNYDFKIFPRINGERDNLQYRLTPEEVVKMQLKDGSNAIDRWKLRLENKEKMLGGRSNCGCGRHSFQIDVWGNVHTCTFNFYTESSLKKKSFQDIWRDYGKRIEECDKKMYIESKCEQCVYANLCDNCPAISYSELGVELQNDAVEYQCEIAKRRFELVEKENGRL